MLNIHMFQPLSHRPFIYIINQQVLATNPQIRDHSTESQMYGCKYWGWLYKEKCHYWCTTTSEHIPIYYILPKMSNIHMFNHVP